jgi:hypothetical protein
MKDKTLFWNPPVELSQIEKMICKRLTRTGRLFAFLRQHRHELFDDSFQAELARMYSDKPRGTKPKPPAMLALVTLLQAYERKSDAAAVEEAVFDRRWQMVLDCHGAESPPFSQGVLVDFRRRLMEHDMDRRLLERTVELAERTGDFGGKMLRVALDSSPLWGAGRVEDTFNLIGHSVEIIVECAAKVWGRKPDDVYAAAELTLFGGPSLKAALDVDWDDASQQGAALMRVIGEVRRLREWIAKTIPDKVGEPEMLQALAMLEQVMAQDLEPDPDGGGMRIKRGVAKDRRISVADGDMRHGRKSKSKVISGYKRHVVRDLDSPMILAATVRPANEPEHQAAAELRPRVERFGEVAELHIDRGYLASEWARDVFDSGARLLAKPWVPRNGNCFPKNAFTIDLARGVVRCPENVEAEIHGDKACFDPTVCDVCASRDQCTRAALGRGRTISIHPDEAMFVELRRRKQTPEGRQLLRERVAIEHCLAHVCRRQGPRARYWGVRKNVFDLHRVCTVENLHALDRLREAA